MVAALTPTLNQALQVLPMIGLHYACFQAEKPLELPPDAFNDLSVAEARIAANKAPAKEKLDDKFAQATGRDIIDVKVRSIISINQYRGEYKESIKRTSSQVKDTLKKFCDSLLAKVSKMRALLKELQKFDPQETQKLLAQKAFKKVISGFRKCPGVA